MADQAGERARRFFGHRNLPVSRLPVSRQTSD